MPSRIDPTIAASAAPLGEAIHQIVVQPAKVEVKVEVPADERSLMAPGTYASALPGVFIAIAGFYVVHSLARRRDREKRLMEMAQDIHALAGQAASTAAEAWAASKGSKRLQTVNQARQNFQMLGSAVTRIQYAAAGVARRHSIVDCCKALTIKPLFQKRQINLSKELLSFRTTSLNDPFADPNRGPDHGVIADIHIELGAFTHALDQMLTRCLP